MAAKVVFLDIDGTILTEDKRIPSSTRLAVNQLLSKGIKVVLATGRSPYFTNPIAQELGVHSYVSFNGSIANHENEIIFEKKLEMEYVREIIGKCVQLSHLSVLQASYSLFSHAGKEDIRLTNYFGYFNVSVPEGIHLDYDNEDIYQIYLHCPHQQEELYRFDTMGIDRIRYNDFDLDILPKGVSKAVGITAMLKMMNISASEAVAFGDGYNDMEMLDLVGVGIAMGNAETALKQVADFVTKPVYEDGIMFGLKKLGLL